jgi:23S rRNA pseudouridine2457 synthase
MADIILFNKPYGVITQFSAHEKHRTLAEYISQKGFYPAGRLDTDSEGLLLLTNHGGLQHYVSHPKTKLPKTYWVQVEGEPSEAQLNALKNGVDLGDFVTLPAQVQRINPPDIWPRIPPIRVRLSIPDRWLELTIVEGKNRQVRRMTAKVGLPTLRLIRVAIGPWRVDNLAQGNSQLLHISDDFSTLAAYR